MKTEVLYGIHPVREVIRAGRRRVDGLMLSQANSPQKNKKGIQLGEENKIPVDIISSNRMDQLTGSRFHQGMAARVSPYPWMDLDQILRQTGHSDRPPFYLILDQIVDPQNLGAVLRTSVCAGADYVVICKKRSAMPTPAVCKASAGAMEHVRLCRVTNLSVALELLKDKGFLAAGLDRSAAKVIYEADFTGPMALVVGGEQKGIRPLVKRHCDALFGIPQKGRIDSLNASVAGAVAMYEVVRQRTTPS